jgi:hypothetical protein
MALSHSEILPFSSLGDDRFNLEIFELNTGQVNFNRDSSVSLSYNSLFANIMQINTLYHRQ